MTQALEEVGDGTCRSIRNGWSARTHWGHGTPTTAPRQLESIKNLAGFDAAAPHKATGHKAERKRRAGSGGPQCTSHARLENFVAPEQTRRSGAPGTT